MLANYLNDPIQNSMLQLLLTAKFCADFPSFSADRIRTPDRSVTAVIVSGFVQDYGVTASEAAPVVAAFRREPKVWRDFMMRFELGLEAPYS